MQLLMRDGGVLREQAGKPWAGAVAESILAEALTFEGLPDSDLRDWPTADLVPRWAWDSRSDEIERIGDNRDAFIRAMGSVRRSQRIRRELFTLAAAAALNPDRATLRDTALRSWRAPLGFRRWQYPGWTLYYKEHTMPADGDGEWGATENYLVVLPLCAEVLREWLTEDDLRLERRRVAEFCSRIEDDFWVGRSWFFDGANGGVPAGNQFTQVIGGLAVGALSLVGHDPRAQRWVDLATTQMLRSMDATGRDGSYFEGAAYGLGTMEQVWMVADLLHHRGDDRLLDHPQVRNFPYWLMDTLLQDREHWLPLNDSGGSLRQETLYNRRRNWAARVLALAARLTRDSALAWCLEEVVGGPSTDIFGLLQYDQSVEARQPVCRSGLIRMQPSEEWIDQADDHIPRGTEVSAAGADRDVVHYPQQGIVIARTGFDPESVLVALKGGWSSRGHDHNDRNSILVYDGPAAVITETGPGPYSDPEFDLHFGSHHAHSTLQLDGEIHPHGRAARGVEGVERLGDGSIRMVGEAQHSYPGLRLFRREIMVRFPGRVEIRDTLQPADGKPHQAAFWFHVPLGARMDEESVGPAILIPGHGERLWRLTARSSGRELAEEHLGGEGSENRRAFVFRVLLPAAGAEYGFDLELLGAGP